MPKIPFDGKKVHTRPIVEYIHKEREKFYEDVYRAKLDGKTMDDKTKATLEGLLDKVRTPPRTKTTYRRPGAYGGYEHAVPPMDAEARARDLEAAKARAFEEASERAAESIRRAAWIKRDEEATEERTRRANEPARFESSVYLLDEVACVSVNSAKACVVINCPISRSLYDLLIDRFKGGKLKYDAKLGVWEAHPSIMPELRPILKSHFKDVQVLGVPKALPATKFDQLIAKLDKDDRSKIYKLLALKYHTDRGGSHETMVLINQVFKES